MYELVLEVQGLGNSQFSLVGIQFARWIITTSSTVMVTSLAKGGLTPLLGATSAAKAGVKFKSSTATPVRKDLCMVTRKTKRQSRAVIHTAGVFLPDQVRLQ